MSNKKKQEIKQEVEVKASTPSKKYRIMIDYANYADETFDTIEDAKKYIEKQQQKIKDEMSPPSSFYIV